MYFGSTISDLDTVMCRGCIISGSVYAEVDTIIVCIELDTLLFMVSVLLRLIYTLYVLRLIQVVCAEVDPYCLYLSSWD